MVLCSHEFIITCCSHLSWLILHREAMNHLQVMQLQFLVNQLQYAITLGPLNK